MTGIEPRVAVLAPYWPFWEHSVPYDLRADRARLAGEVVMALEGCAVLSCESFESVESAGQVASRIDGDGTDALLVIQSMAVPPAFTTVVLDALPELPLVVWAVHRQRALQASFGHSDITTAGATVGTSQLAGALGRRGRRWTPIVGPLGDHSTRRALRCALQAAAVARRLRTARVGLVGRPQDGYECVECDPRELARATGVTIVPLAPDVFGTAYAEAPEGSTAAVEREIRASFEVDPEAERNGSLGRSLRCAVALEHLGRQQRLDAGAMNCHVAQIRFALDPGIAPCLALGRETSRGIPWTCTGDVPTAVAMLTMKWLGAATLYHELESIDYETDEIAIANTGEHDLGWTFPGDRPRLIRNVWFSADARQGVCACHALRPGAATLVAFTPHAEEPSGFRYVVAEGAITGRTFPATGTPNGAFRFAGGGTAAEGYRRWALAGASHHSCASPGLHADAVTEVAEHLGVGCVRVSAR